jgi:dihydroorotase
MPSVLIRNATIVNEGKTFRGDILIENGVIAKISPTPLLTTHYSLPTTQIIDAEGKYLLPGVIDTHVHFREPGLVYKADIYTESKAAVAGGVTSFMDMPNTFPPVLTQELLEEKYTIASQKSIANYSFYMGTSNDNYEEVIKTNPKNVCGIKIYLGSSTGNMLVDNPESIEKLFDIKSLLIAVHCEEESIIKANAKRIKEQYGDNPPPSCHPVIRNEECCYHSSHHAVELAKKQGTRLHVVHVSTEKETSLFDNSVSLEKKKITSEVCPHHLWFSDKDYVSKGNMIKWNPAIKTEHDKTGLLQALLDNKIDTIATDHAPHTHDEKEQAYFSCPSGGPMVQHSLTVMLELHKQGKISLENVVQKMCHAPATCFQVEKRGFIREGYWADIILVDLNNPWKVEKSNILYKCQWSPLEGETFHSKVTHTFVNGNLVYSNGTFTESAKGQRILFDR